jgi:hypothetical protein
MNDEWKCEFLFLGMSIEFNEQIIKKLYQVFSKQTIARYWLMRLPRKRSGRLSSHLIVNSKSYVTMDT